MKIYLLKRNDYVCYDEYKGFVIAAKNPEAAIKIANDNAADEGKLWGDVAKVSVSVIGTADKSITEPYILLADFRAG